MDGISNSEIKKIKSLNVKKFRDSLGLFTVEGEKMTEEALSSAFCVEKVFRTREIGTEAMARISSMSTPPPVLAVVRKPENTEISPAEASRIIGNRGLYLFLDRMRDPGNLGTVIRIADWFGIDGIFASSDTVDLFNPKVVQATMGAIFRVKFHYTDIVETARLLSGNGGKIYGTFLDGRDMYGCDLDTGENAASVIVTGNESEGISREMASVVTDRLFIPPYPNGLAGSESLNAAVATAVAVAEFRRRSRV